MGRHPTGFKVYQTKAYKELQSYKTLNYEN